MIHVIVIYLDLANFGAQCGRFLTLDETSVFIKVESTYGRTYSLLPSSNADVKNACTYTSISPYAFMVSRDYFIFHISLSFLDDVKLKKIQDFRMLYIQGVPGGMCQTSGGCSLC